MPSSPEPAWTTQDVVAHLRHVLRFASLGTADKVEAHDLLAYLEAYDEVYPISQDHANAVSHFLWHAWSWRSPNIGAASAHADVERHVRGTVPGCETCQQIRDAVERARRAEADETPITTHAEAEAYIDDVTTRKRDIV